MSSELKPRQDFLDTALACGATLTGKPDGSEAITVVFTIDAWRKFDTAIQQAESEPVGYMNAGQLHELQQGRSPYGYIYPQSGVGADIELFTHPAPGVPDDVVRDAKRWRVSELISEAALKHPDSRTEAENTAFNAYRASISSGNGYASCIDAAMLAASTSKKDGAT